MECFTNEAGKNRRAGARKYAGVTGMMKTVPLSYKSLSIKHLKYSHPAAITNYT